MDRTKALHGPRTQAYGETKFKNCCYYEFWIESRPCMVPGPKHGIKPPVLSSASMGNHYFSLVGLIGPNTYIRVTATSFYYQVFWS